MSMSSERMMKLMAYADGELEGAERDEVEKLVASNEEAARIVDAMLGLGDFVREGHEDKLAPVIAKVNLTGAIMKSVEKAEIEPARPVKAAGHVSSLDAARAKKRNVGVGIVAALALAASVFVMMRDKTDEKPMAAKPVPTQTQRSPATSPVPQQMASVEAPSMNASTSAGVEVQAFESPGHSVSVFYLPTANELSTSVTVWVDETGEKK
jgi:anti-sigma factor RsiW